MPVATPMLVSISLAPEPLSFPAAFSACTADAAKALSNAEAA
jgi:hypothetical protein